MLHSSYLGIHLPEGGDCLRMEGAFLGTGLDDWPALVVEVAFTEWTRDGNLRHGAYVSVRDDKRPRDVHREASA